MRKFIIAALALVALSASARAQSTVAPVISSTTYCTVSVSTSVATRVDNFNGGCEGLMTGRNEVKVVNPTGNTTINCAYTVSVSTQQSSTRIGEEIVAAAKVDMNLASIVGYWCMSQAASAAQKIHVTQASPFRTPGL